MDIDMNRKESRRATLFDRGLVRVALRQSFLMLNPWTMARNPVMFITEIGAALTTLVWLIDIFSGNANLLYTTLVMLVLWITVLFANFAEALAEARGKAQADSLKNSRETDPRKSAWQFRRTGIREFRGTSRRRYCRGQCRRDDSRRRRGDRRCGKH